MQIYVVTMLIVVYTGKVIADEGDIFQGFIIPCKDTSPACIRESFQAVLPDFVRGISSLAIKPLDPFLVDKLNLALPGGLAIEFNEGQIKGLRKCTINSASVSENRLNAVLHCNLTIKGNYRANGKMLMFPVDGNGDATIVCKNLKFECSFEIGTTERNGKVYLLLEEHDIKHSYQGPIFFKITNLVKRNPEVSNMILEFMNKNWLAVAEEFGDPIVNVGIQSIVHNIEKLIETVPADQLLRVLERTDAEIKEQ